MSHREPYFWKCFLEFFFARMAKFYFIDLINFFESQLSGFLKFHTQFFLLYMWMSRRGEEKKLSHGTAEVTSCVRRNSKPVIYHLPSFMNLLSVLNICPCLLIVHVKFVHISQATIKIILKTFMNISMFCIETVWCLSLTLSYEMHLGYALTCANFRF